jgi:signal transduction histidine kinase
VPTGTPYPQSMRVESRPARFIREHPVWADGAIVSFATFVSLTSADYVATLVPLPVAAVLQLVPPVVLIVRRLKPRLVLAITLAFGLLQWGLAVPLNGAQASALIALYTVARYEPKRPARVALGASLALVALAPLRQPFVGLGNSVLVVGLIVLVYLLGTNVGLRKRYLLGLEERAVQLEQERDAATEVAAVRERTRIARELHDVVAHHVSVMVVQAEGAGWAIDDRPEQARAAVATIAETGRSTLIELRRLLGVLRAGDEDGVAPQPGLADLPALIEGFRGSGLSVSSSWPGSGPDPDLGELPDGLQLAAFRIVQEGLTNVLKHAGPTARAQVGVRRDAAQLLVEIEDDGTGPGGHPDGGGPLGTGPGVVGSGSGAPGTGHGVIGIRERVALFGGQVDIGPVPGGFAVRARIPVAP